jgi:hypothetical protein
MILLYRGKSMISKIIQWQTFGPYSHAAWWCADKSVVEAWHKGGVTHNASPATIHTPGTEIDVFDIAGMTEHQRFLIEQYVKEEFGCDYDFAPVLRGFPLRLNRDNLEKWFCSELLFSKVRKAGIELLREVPAFKVHPTLLSYSPLLWKIGTIITGKKSEYKFTPAPPPTRHSPPATLHSPLSICHPPLSTLHSPLATSHPTPDTRHSQSGGSAQ